MKSITPTDDGLSRHTFLKTTAAATAGVSVGLMASNNFAYAAGSDTIRVGLVGCGGRGTGAARDAVTSAEGVRLVAMADLFEDRLDNSRNILAEEIYDHFDVTDDRCYVGFNAYQELIDSDLDMVILATPPGFRPLHLRAAVEAGKHVFMEKPAAVDVAGLHSIIASGEIARQKGLSIVAGTLYRRQPSFMEAVNRIHDGMIGDVVSAQAYYLTGPIWLRDRKPGMSDMEWQCRNWYYFTWLSGDHIVEQFVHNLDVMYWVFGQAPASCIGMGGRIVRVDPSYGHIYDHFSIEYRLANGVKIEAKCRQMAGVTNSVTNRIVGTKGVADLHPGNSVIMGHDGTVLFEHPERGNNAYVQEHTDLIHSIREGKPLNEAEQVAISTGYAVMGRESAYTGKELSWDEVMNANLDLVPRTFAFASMPMPAIAQPGMTTLNRSPWAEEAPATTSLGG